jgi:hypothetical protein
VRTHCAPDSFAALGLDVKNLVGLFAALILIVGDAVANSSIVIGQGIKVESVGALANDWVAGYVWLIDARLSPDHLSKARYASLPQVTQNRRTAI